MSHKKKRNIIIVSLCGVLLLMVVGYAAFSSVLKIKGTSNINSNWDIKITSITSEVLHGSATNAKDPEGIGTLEASFETNLVSPGDSIEYTITVSNQGNINAKLDKITLSEPDNEYVTFETSGLTEGDKLNAGSTVDLIVTVTFKDVEINKMEKSTSNLTVTLDYNQADSSSDMPGPELPSVINMKGIEVPIVKEGTLQDGLYVDTYEDGRYVYKGANPNNYITFNNEPWRIIAIETDGTLKLIKKVKVGNRVFDKTGGTYGSNNWARPADLNTYLNNDYYNMLNDDAKTLIEEHSWRIGPVKGGNNSLVDQIQSENSVTWTGNIGLISLSDFLRINTNTEQCGNFSLTSTNGETCKTTSYLIPISGYYIFISPGMGNTNGVYNIGSNGGLRADYANNSYYGGVLPSLYLKSDITLSGSGTETEPYTITAG